MQRIVGLSACAAVLFLGTVTVAASQPMSISIRARSMLPENVERVLHELAISTEVDVPANADVEQFLHHNCGGSPSEFYIRQFIELNKAKHASPLGRARNAREMLLPACAKIRTARAGAAAYVMPGDVNIDDILQRHLSAKASTTLIICDPVATSTSVRSPCIQRTAGDWLLQRLRLATLSPLSLPIWTRIDLPFASQWTTVWLKDGIAPDYAIRRLEEAAEATAVKQDLMEVQAGNKFLPYGQQTLPTDPTNPCTLSGAPPRNWPFNRDRVAAALRDALPMLEARSSRPSARAQRLPSYIRIGDTGIRNGEGGTPGGFPPKLLVTDSTGRYGISAEVGGRLEPRPGEDNGEHGAEVAELALGGREFWSKEVDLLARFLRLNFARVYFTIKDQREIAPDMLTRSLSEPNPQVSIANLSLGGPEPISSLEAHLRSMSTTGQLLVLAAGNTNTEAIKEFPVAFAARPEFRNSILVVGAHGPLSVDGGGRLRGERAWFSNHGANVVDLLAPGCQLIAGPASPPGTVLIGTSYAAPLVSFTSGLLRMLLPIEGTVHIRNRLQATVASVSESADETTFGGVLDIEAALRVFDDVVRLPDGRLLHGRWQPSGSRIQICRAPDGTTPQRLHPPEVHRIRVLPAEPSSGARLRLTLTKRMNVSQPLNNELSPTQTCEPASLYGPTLLLDGDSVPRTFRWDEIAAFIPAVSMEERRGGETLAGPAPVTTASSVAEAATRSPVRANTLTDIERAQNRAVQSALTQLGLMSGPSDGFVGPQTTEAIREFQRRRGEVPSGILAPLQTRSLLSTIALDRD